MSRRFLTFVSSALLCLLQPAHSQETPAPKRDVAVVRLAIALTNSALIAGTNTLLKCWLTNDSATGLSLEWGGGGPDAGNCYLEIWLKAEGGKEYILVHGPGGSYRLHRSAERFVSGEVHNYRLLLPIPAGIPPGRYQLRAKREIHGHGTEVLSNILEVQVK